MSLVEVFGYIFGNGRRMQLQGVQVAISHAGSHFESDVEKLPEMGIKIGAALVMAERVDEALRVPGVNLFRRW